MALPNDLITPREAAGVLAAHLSSVHRWIQTGKLPAYRRASRWLVSRADVERMLVPTESAAARYTTRAHDQAMQELARAGLA